MLAAQVKDDANGERVLEIWENPSHCRVIAMQAIATRSELWGIEDPVEVVEAIIEAQDGPPEDLNAYADVYPLLAHREQERERAVAEARKKREDKLAPSDPRSLTLVSALAAYRAVHVPVAPGEECAMDRCRRAVRASNQLTTEPSRKPGATSRMKLASVHVVDQPDIAPIGPLTHEQDRQDRQAKLSALLAQVTWIIDEDRRSFLHELTGNTMNSLEDVPQRPEEAPEATAEDLLGKYGAR